MYCSFSLLHSHHTPTTTNATAADEDEDDDDDDDVLDTQDELTVDEGSLVRLENCLETG